MGTLTDRAKEKVAGPSWEALRTHFYEVADTLLSVAPTTFADLTTIYIKFTLTSEPSSPVYAVMWVKSSKNLVVGLALPEDSLVEDLCPAPKGMTYRSLTGYFVVTPEQTIPAELKRWAEIAYSHIKRTTE